MSGGRRRVSRIRGAYRPASIAASAADVGRAKLRSAAAAVYRSYPSRGIGSVAPTIATAALKTSNTPATAHTAGWWLFRTHAPAQNRTSGRKITYQRTPNIAQRQSTGRQI